MKLNKSQALPLWFNLPYVFSIFLSTFPQVNTSMYIDQNLLESLLFFGVAEKLKVFFFRKMLFL